MKTKPMSDRCEAQSRATCPYHGVVHAFSTDQPSFLLADQAGHVAYATVLTVANQRTRGVELRQLHAVPLKKASVETLTRMVLTESDKLGMDKKRVRSALKLAAFLHRDDTRNDPNVGAGEAYIGHPLRNTVRAIRLGSTSETVIVGSLFHDTVEDHPKDLASLTGAVGLEEVESRSHALDYLAHNYGRPVSNMVAGMSNPIMPKYMPAEQRNKIYADHVAEAIEDPDVLVGKHCDFTDNALSLKHSQHHMKPEAVGRRARKYLPVLDIIHDRIARDTAAQIGFSHQGRDYALYSLSQGRVWLEKLSTIDK